ncbi:MAG: pyridoxal-dependent decarboxylase [Acidimicrobiia bacterium]|nr:pyridoxal-dependent decarboxylase [Acidimicrobiia bacterium]
MADLPVDPPLTPVPHLTTDEFRHYGYELVDWLAAYFDSLEDRPVTPTVGPGEIRSRLPAGPPRQGEPFEAIIADLDAIIMPGVTHWQSPRWFGYFPANSSPASVLGELVAAGLGVQGMLWSTSPAATELETVVMDWLVDLLALPGAWKTTGPGGGVIQMSASDSTHLALVVARHQARQRASTDDMVAYASREAHSSIEKGARIAGFRHLRLIDVDTEFAMDPRQLEGAVAADIAAGRLPVVVTSTVGTTGTTAVDPVRAVGSIARNYGLWHHVDAAYAGSAMICPEFRHHQDGLDLVDSYTFNPHKWMLTNFDCSAFYVADRTPLIEATSVLPPYLRDSASATGEVIDYRDWHVPLGRRFRSLKLWFVLRSYGVEGLQAHIRNSVGLASWLTDRVMADRRFQMVAPTRFGLVGFRHAGGDGPTDRLADAINASGEAFLTPSTIDGQRFIRVAIGQHRTDEGHVRALWEQIDDLAEQL